VADRAPSAVDRGLPDLLRLRGSVVAASDEFFAEKENLIKASAPVFAAASFGPRGQVYDGWETRRRRGPSGGLPESEARDWVIVRLGAPGVVRSVVVDTAFFTGNYPQACSVDACSVAGYPAASALVSLSCDWREIVPRSALAGDTRQEFDISSGRRFTHVRLNIFPDGGVARLYVPGEVVPDPSVLEGLSVDLAALENGGDVVACSDEFYSAPRNVLSPGLARVMGEGWETRRRRAAGHEWLVVRLTGRGVVALAEIDTAGYRGNAPGTASLQAADGPSGPWRDLLRPVPLVPDTPHRFRVSGTPATHVRLNIFPDGGVARLRLYGHLTEDGLAAVRRRWEETTVLHRLPAPAVVVLAHYPFAVTGESGRAVVDLTAEFAGFVARAFVAYRIAVCRGGRGCLRGRRGTGGGRRRIAEHGAWGVGGRRTRGLGGGAWQPGGGTGCSG
jgi:allantoicase